MAYQYRQSLYVGSTYNGYVDYNVSPSFDHKLAVGDTVTITGQAYRKTYSVKSIYCDICGSGIYVMGGLFDFNANPKSLWPGIGYVNKTIEKAKTGAFTITIPITQEVIDRIEDDPYTIDADQGDGTYDYAKYFSFSYLAGTHADNLRNNDPNYDVPHPTSETHPHYSFIVDGRAQPSSLSVDFSERYVEGRDTKINGMSPLDYFSAVVGGIDYIFVQNMSHPVVTVDFDLDDRDPQQAAQLIFEWTDPDNTEHVKYATGGDGERSISMVIGEPIGGWWDYTIHRFTQAGVYSYTATIKLVSAGKSPELSQKSVSGTFGVYPEYVKPNMSSFSVDRCSLTRASSGNYVEYDIGSNYSSVIASGQPPIILRDAELTLSFVRKINGVDTPFTVDADPSGHGVIEVNGVPMEIRSEELFSITATLTDGIVSVSMTSGIEPNFAIFNCNAEKNSVGIGKYCDGTFTGLDVDMAAMFRRAVTFNVPPVGLECLWLRTSSATTMGATTVTLTRAITAGELLIVVFAAYQANARNHVAIGVGGDATYLHYTYASNNRIGSRTITTVGGSASASISVATYNGSTSNEHCIPLGIYAIKGNWFNVDSANANYSAPT